MRLTIMMTLIIIAMINNMRWWLIIWGDGDDNCNKFDDNNQVVS